MSAAGAAVGASMWRKDVIKEAKKTHKAMLKTLNKHQFLFSERREFKHAMLDSQGGKCAVCGRPVCFGGKGPEKACVDHDHKTGIVRGITCGPCNIGLGCFGDNRLALFCAARYLSGGFKSMVDVSGGHCQTYRRPMPFSARPKTSSLAYLLNRARDGGVLTEVERRGAVSEIHANAYDWSIQKIAQLTNATQRDIKCDFKILGLDKPVKARINGEDCWRYVNR